MSWSYDRQKWPATLTQKQSSVWGTCSVRSLQSSKLKVVTMTTIFHFSQMSEKRSLSFSMAIRPRTNEFAVNIGSQTPIMKKLPIRQRYFNFIADEYLPKETDRTSFLNNCSWCLPPVIVLVMCVLQVCPLFFSFLIFSFCCLEGSCSL